MKKLFLAFAISVLALSAYAQESAVADAEQQTKKTLVSDSYNRNSIAVITITHGDNHDTDIIAASDSLPDKYDLNKIPLRTIKSQFNRSEASNEDTEALLVDNKVGKMLVSYLFNRQKDGTMDDLLLQQRSRYNATDQDVLSARASAVGEGNLFFQYDKLINSSYILVFDETNIKEKTVTDKKGKQTTTYSATGQAAVYKVDFDLDQAYASWIYPEDAVDVKAQKNKAYDDMEVNLTFVAKTDVVASSTKGYKEAISNAYYEIYDNLEKKIDSWQVRVSVYSIKPIVAKVGKKEGLSNGLRYRTYVTKEDEDGQLYSQKKGYVRATTVVDNRMNATGESEGSKFVQISGAQNVGEGWLMKEDKDIKLGVALAPKVGGISSYSIGADIDYLAYILNNGHQVKGILNADLNFGGEMTASAALGVGYQMLLVKRKLLIEPFAHVGADELLTENDDYDEYGLFVGGGVNVGLQFYPIQVYVKAGYDMMLLETPYYQSRVGAYRGSSPFIGIGLRFEL